VTFVNFLAGEIERESKIKRGKRTEGASLLAKSKGSLGRGGRSRGGVSEWLGRESSARGISSSVSPMVSEETRGLLF